MRTANSKKASRHVLSAFLLVAVGGLVFPYGSPSAQASCSYPAQILDLTSWKETLPTGSSGSPTEIKQPTLATFLTNPFFQPTSGCDGVTFRAPVNGVTTSGSGYPRSELREMTANGTELASWSTTSGTHTMYIDQAITAVPQTKKHVVAGQIHDSEDDVIVIRLEYPKLFVDINGNDGPVLDSNYQLGKRFTVKFEAGNGQIRIYYNGNPSPAYTLNKKGSGNYFKAGAYTQSNCSKESSCDGNNYGEVNIYKLTLGHSDSNTVNSAPIADTSAPTSTASQAGETQAPIEAEIGIVKSPMQIVESASASSGKYIVQTVGKKRGLARYTVAIPSKGKYRIRGRVIAPNGSANSFYYKVDGKPFKKWNFPSNIKDWAWTNGPTVKLSKGGNHRLTIKKREANTCLDTFEFKKL